MHNTDDWLDYFFDDLTIEDFTCTYCVFNPGWEVTCDQECSVARERRMVWEREKASWGN